ncbi:MAG: FAD-binding oxidoreductase [Nocardioidaceae bacterium]
MTTPLVSRRTVIKGAAVGAAAATGGYAVAQAGSGGGSAAPVTSGHAGAPPQSAWRALERSIDGDVVRRGDRDYGETKELFNPRWDTIRPLAVVEAVSSADVAEAIRFAQKFDLPCRPKSGGHSYVGASTVRSGLVIDVGRMQGVRYDAASQHAIVGAGATLYPVHRALAEHGRTLPTGTCPTVGAAGLTLGGGLGVDSRAHGLTADRLVQLRIVTADGVIRNVDSDRHDDLLWACRGGGGGNFGIVTQMRFQTHATRRMGFFLLSFPWRRAPAVLRGWARRIQHMPHSSWANVHLEAHSGGGNEVRIVGVCRAGDEGNEAAAMQRAIGVDATDVSTFSKSFLDGVRFLGGGTTSPRQGFAAGSDVLGNLPRRTSFDLPRLMEQRASHDHAATAILDPLTGGVHARGPRGTAFPWRRHLASIQWYLSMPGHPTMRQVHAAYHWIGTAHHAVAGPSVGGYVNYLEPRRHVGSYYGENFARLKHLRHKWDPDGFFTSPYAIA